jgi:hypothetical protein
MPPPTKRKGSAMSDVLEKGGHGPDEHPDHDDKTKTVTIKVDGIDRVVPKTKMTAAELKAFLGIAATQVIDTVGEDGIFHPVADNETIKLREGLVLVSHGRGGASS